MLRQISSPFQGSGGGEDDKPQWDIRYLGGALSAIQNAGGSAADLANYINDYATLTGANEAQQKYAKMLSNVIKYGMN